MANKVLMITATLFLAGCYFPQQQVEIIAKYKAKGPNAGAQLTSTENFGSPKLEDECKNDQKLSEQITLSFAPTVGMECEWGVGDNKEKGSMGTLVAAYRSQKVMVNLKQGRKLCAIKMDSSKLGNRYNDAIIMTLQNRLIASHSLNSEKNRSILESAKLAEKIDKKNLIGMKQKYGTFCPEGVKCEIPRSLSNKPLSIDVLPQYLKHLAPEELTGSLAFELILTGNRSIIDCQHSGLDLNFRYTYVDEDPVTSVAH